MDRVTEMGVSVVAVPRAEEEGGLGPCARPEAAHPLSRPRWHRQLALQAPRGVIAVEGGLLLIRRALLNLGSAEALPFL